MQNIVFKHLLVENFCGLKKFETDFYDRTIIKGQNKVGKSTIRNAIYWLLTDKLSDGGAIDGIRPRDTEGNDIHHIDVIGCLTMDIDGQEIRVKKTYSEDYIKNKTTMSQEFKGNKTTYEINEIPKRKTDFTDFLNQYIDLDTLSLCMNPLVFLRLNSKERRATLFSLVDNADDDVLASDSKFKELESDLKIGTIDELIIRSKATIKKCNERIKVLPDLITNEESHIVELSDNEIKALRQELAENEAKITEFDNAKNVREDLSKRITDAKAKLSQVDIDYRIAQQKATADADIAKQKLINECAVLRGMIPQIESRIKEAENRVADMKSSSFLYANDIEKIKAEEFNGENLKCPVCGSKYTKAKVDGLRKAWQESQDKKIEDLTRMSNDAEVRSQEIEADINKWKSEISEKQAEIEAKEKEIGVIENLPAPVVDAPDMSVKKALTDDIAKWESELDSLNVSDGAEKQEILNKIKNINNQLNALNTNEAFRANVESFRQELLNLSQQVADEERKIDLMQLYQKAKIGTITDTINSYFNVICWRFFKPQINGSFAEVCEPLVGGVSLDGLLNRGDSILAMADLCQAFQKKAGINVPIILDDCESVDEWRLPTAENQLLFIRRTDDKSLTIQALS